MSDAEDAIQVEEAEDPESSPAIPAASVAAQAAAITGADARATDREIWALAWPVIGSQVLASMVSLIDIAMLGRLGPRALAAVGYVTQFFWLSQAVLMAVGIAGVALMSRSLGASQPERARAALAGCLILAVAVAAVLAAAILAAPLPILALLNAPPDVAQTALPYLQLTLASTLLFAVSVTYESGFRAAKDTRTPMWIAAVVTGVKVVLNALLIFGLGGLPRLDLVGAGLATVGAQAVAVVLLIAASRRAISRRALGLGRADFRAARGALREVSRIAAPAVGERVVLNLAMMSFFTVLGHYGSAAIAAYTVGVRVLSFSWIPGTGFAAAAATLVGHALGGDDPNAAIRAGWRSARFAVLVSVALGAVFLLAREPLARTFTNDAGVIDELLPFMLVLAVAQPLLGLHFTLGGALRGAGDTLTPLLAAALGNWAFRVPLALLFANVLGLEVIWIWLAMVFDHLARALWLGVAFHRGRWRPTLSPSS
ncbi:MAG: MATE family efflux transporter [Myxococcota bacterium]|nr:MATE family efflux transporter [Myxococcota bacterium]